MTNEPGSRYHHVAVRLADYIIVIGGKWEEFVPAFQREIWKYNLNIGKWK